MKHIPPASITLTPSTVSDREPLRAIVNAWSRISGQPQNNLWPQVRAAFNTTNIKQLPAEWVPDAIAWVQGKIDALPSLPVTSAPTQPALPQSSAVLDAHVQKVQSAMAAVQRLTSELLSATSTLQFALLFRPAKLDAAVPALGRALERNLPTFSTAIGMNAAALSQLLDVYKGVLQGPAI